METEIKAFKSTVPHLVKRVADWFEIELTIRLFGVKVFSFVWPPRDEKIDSTSNS